MFGDLPRGHHKNKSMHKLASKTMIEILPDNLAAHVEKKCGALAGKPRKNIDQRIYCFLFLRYT